MVIPSLPVACIAATGNEGIVDINSTINGMHGERKVIVMEVSHFSTVRKMPIPKQGIIDKINKCSMEDNLQKLLTKSFETKADNVGEYDRLELSNSTEKAPSISLYNRDIIKPFNDPNPSKATDSQNISENSGMQQNTENSSMVDDLKRWRPYTGLTRHMLVGYIGTEIHAKDYINGKINIDEYKQAFSARFENLLNSFIAGGRTDGTKPRDIADILSFSYADFFEHAIFTAYNENGRMGAEKYGSGGMYYNSDFYYLSQEMIGALNEKFTELSAKYGLEGLERPQLHYTDFNSLWGQYYPEVVEFNYAEAGPPPRGFEFHFRAHAYSAGIDSFEEYRFEAYDGNGDNHVWTVYAPKGRLFRQETSLMDMLLQKHFKQKQLVWPEDHRVETLSYYDVSDLLKDYRGANIQAKLSNFVLDNFYNHEAARLSVNYGGRQTEYEIPFLMGHIFRYGGKRLIDEKIEASQYLSNFVFKQGIPGTAQQHFLNQR